MWFRIVLVASAMTFVIVGWQIAETPSDPSIEDAGLAFATAPLPPPTTTRCYLDGTPIDCDDLNGIEEGSPITGTERHELGRPI